MSTKTPVFDAALDTILTGLKPHTRTCEQTGESFEVDAKTVELCTSFRVPPPRAIWWSRIRHLETFLGGFDLFRKTQPDGTSIITMFDPQSFTRVLPSKEWYSDTFDPMVYGQSLDLNRPFFEQWATLTRAVPRPAIIQDPGCENSEWCLYSHHVKDCYFNHLGFENEGLLYSDANAWSKNDLSITLCGHCEACYECVACFNCSHVFFSDHCKECINVSFSRSCTNCTDCFGCVNLRNKKFCFFNEQLTEEEYRRKLAEIDLRDRAVVEAWQKKAHAFWDTTFRLAYVAKNSEHAIGDDIENSRDAYGITIRFSERVYQSTYAIEAKDGWMNYLGIQYERCYSCCNSGLGAFNNKMSNWCEGSIDVEYCELLRNCTNCFGCIGLKNKKFCILNTQYTEEEYWPLVDALKTAMLQRGDYGEFFPLVDSPYAYNTSYAQTMFPLGVGEVEALKGRWYDFTSEQDSSDAPLVPAMVDEQDQTILTKAFRCPETGRLFRFVKPEVEFHRRNRLALPKTHPTVRRTARMLQIGSARLYPHACDQCHQRMEIRIAPPYSTLLFCPDCFEKNTL